MTDAQDSAKKLAKANGLIEVYFPNGTAYTRYLERCEECRHWVDDMLGQQPPKSEPPFAMCKWGVLDRIILASPSDRYGCGTSFHRSDDMEVVNLSPRCKRYTPIYYPHDDRDPPTPDIPGQMLLGESKRGGQ